MARALEVGDFAHEWIGHLIRMSLVIAPARCQTLCRCDVAATDLEHVGDFRLGNNTMSDAPVQHNTAPRPMLCNRKYTAIRVELY
ncbi:hypothetical protein KL929_004499 [Ogataea haglerorum]|nr:hypothetical protein KL929_004499 [Ogataea haglerorum]KAG7803678.1 hypothetical protein KL944_001631 [Ogataea haglerorum]